jgi:hypothetical protein
MKTILKIFPIFSACLANFCHADTTKNESVPGSFFGIDLGEVVEYDSINKSPKLATKIIRTDIDSGGLIVYIRPKTENAMFPFQVAKDPSDTKTTGASNFVLLTPIPPKSKIKPNQLKQLDLFKYEITEIRWSDISKGPNFSSEKADYFWAKNLCDALKLKINTKPKIDDNEKLDLYSCEFEQSGRSLQIHSITGKSMKLTYSKNTMDRKYSDLKKYAQNIIADAALGK